METKKAEVKTDPKLAAVVRGLGSDVIKIIKILESHFGIDIDRDGKVGGTKLVSLLVLLVASVMCFGATQWNLRDSANTYDTANITDGGAITLKSAISTTTFSVSTAGDVVVGNDLAVAGDLASVGAVSGVNLTSSGLITHTPTATSVTNGQALTVAAGSYIFSGTGQANNFTNTITLAAPATAGQLVYLMVATASSNLVAIADSGTVAASGGIEMDGNDTSVLMSVDTNTWLLVTESNN